MITRDRETNINLVSFVSPESRRDGRIYDEDIRRAFNETKRFDLVIVAAIDVTGAPSTRFFGKASSTTSSWSPRPASMMKPQLTRLIARLGLDAKKVRGAVLTGADG